MKISFESNDASAELFVKILCKLSNLSGKNRRIRIGGDEYEYIAGIDGLTDISVNDKLFSDMTSQDKQDLETIRNTAVPVSSTTHSATKISTTHTANKKNNKSSDSIDLCSADATLVKNVILNKMNQGEMFTAFDITKDLRQQGSQIQHRNIKEIVHALFDHGEMSGYNRSLVDVGTNTRPFLYHPVSADISAYSNSKD